MRAEDITERWNRYLGPWLTRDYDLVHPNAARGGGGPGRFTRPGPLSGNYDFFPTLPGPDSPMTRYLAQNSPRNPASSASDAGAGAGAPAADLNQALLKAAQDRIGKDHLVVEEHLKTTKDNRTIKVSKGDGQCTELPSKLLEKLGASDLYDFTPNIQDELADYVWGKKVEAKDAIPGDVIQFKDYTYKRTNRKQVEIRKDSKGKVISRNETRLDDENWTAKHHTAILESMKGDGRMQVIQQHVHHNDPTRSGLVNEDILDLQSAARRDTLTRTRTEFDPYSGEPGGTTYTIETRITEDVKVDGEVKFYRPQKAPVKP